MFNKKLKTHFIVFQNKNKKTISRAGVEPTALTVLRLCHNQLDHPDICNLFIINLIIINTYSFNTIKIKK